MALTLHGTVADNTAVLSRPNAKPLIINGDISVAQRATSKSGINSTGLDVVDRWGYVIGDAGTWTASRSTDGPSTFGFRNAFKWDCTTARGTLGDNTIMHIRQIIEAQNLWFVQGGLSTAKSFTVSFYVRSTVTGTYICHLENFDANRTASTAYTIDASNTWEKKVLNFPADTSGAFADDSGAGLSVNFWVSAGATYAGGTLATAWASKNNANIAVGQVNGASSTSNFFSVSGVQIEVGEYNSTNVPEFQHESIADSQLRCARYYQKMTANNNNFVGRGFSSDGDGRGATQIDTPCPMRASPTVTTSAASTFKFAIGTNGSGNGTSFIVKGVVAQAGMTEGRGFNGTQNFVVWLDIAASGLSNGAFTRGVSNGGSTVELSAEI